MRRDRSASPARQSKLQTPSGLQKPKSRLSFPKSRSHAAVDKTASDEPAEPALVEKSKTTVQPVSKLAEKSSRSTEKSIKPVEKVSKLLEKVAKPTEKEVEQASAELEAPEPTSVVESAPSPLRYAYRKILILKAKYLLYYILFSKLLLLLKSWKFLLISNGPLNLGRLYIFAKRLLRRGMGSRVGCKKTLL